MESTLERLLRGIIQMHAQAATYVTMCEWVSVKVMNKKVVKL